MKNIYYYHSATAEKIANYLAGRRNFRSFDFIRVFKDLNIITTIKGYQEPIKEKKAILIWGNGDDHDISYYFSPEEPYFKSVDDVHDDMRNLTDNEIDCGNHNTALLKYDRQLKGLEVLGVEVRLGNLETLRENYDLNRIGFIRVQPDLDSRLYGQVVHKSIDLDVVENYPCSPEFMGGTWSSKEVKQAFESMLRENDVIRFDVGGLHLNDPRGKPTRAELKGMKAYEELIKIYLDYNTSMV